MDQPIIIHTTYFKKDMIETLTELCNKGYHIVGPITRDKDNVLMATLISPEMKAVQEVVQEHIKKSMTIDIDKLLPKI